MWEPSSELTLIVRGFVDLTPTYKCTPAAMLGVLVRAHAQELHRLTQHASRSFESTERGLDDVAIRFQNDIVDHVTIWRTKPRSLSKLGFSDMNDVSILETSSSDRTFFFSFIHFIRVHYNTSGKLWKNNCQSI